jgi:hypothetical protein
MIPAFDPATGNLPPGEHTATLDEIDARYGYTPERLDMLAGLRRVLDVLRAAGCARVYLDGSFVTATEEPNDYDACWEARGVDEDALPDELLFETADPRREQKEKYGGELFVADWAASPAGTRFRDFFQRDRLGRRKGIIVIELGVLP